MPQQQLNEAHECVEGVEALYSDACHHLAGLGQRAVTQVDTHLRTQAEEACYQVIGLEDALQMHLSHQSHMHMVWYCDGHIQRMATCGVYLICNSDNCNCVCNMSSGSLPLFQPSTRNNYAKHGFHHSASAIWNSLPEQYLKATH